MKEINEIMDAYKKEQKNLTKTKKYVELQEKDKEIEAKGISIKRQSMHIERLKEERKNYENSMALDDMAIRDEYDQKIKKEEVKLKEEKSNLENLKEEREKLVLTKNKTNEEVKKKILQKMNENQDKLRKDLTAEQKKLETEAKKLEIKYDMKKLEMHEFKYQYDEKHNPINGEEYRKMQEEAQKYYEDKKNVEKGIELCKIELGKNKEVIVDIPKLSEYEMYDESVIDKKENKDNKEQSDIDKAWEEAIKENEQRDIDKAWEEAIKENEERDFDKKMQEKRREDLNEFSNQNQLSEEPSDFLDADYKELDGQANNVSELNKADLKIKIDVNKNTIRVLMGNKREKYNLKKTIKSIKKDYIKQYAGRGRKKFREKGMEELIPTILRDIDQKYNTTREMNFRELTNDYYLDMGEEWGKLKLDFDLRKLYKIINPSVPTMSKGKLLDLAKEYQDMDIADLKMGIRTEAIDKIKTLGRKIKDFSQGFILGGEKVEALDEPEIKVEELDVEENAMDKYKVDNKDNRIEDNAKQNVNQSEQNLEDKEEEQIR